MNKWNARNKEGLPKYGRLTCKIVIEGMKVGKAASPSGIVTVMLKIRRGAVGYILITQIVNQVIQEGVVIPNDCYSGTIGKSYHGKGDNTTERGN